MLFGNGDFKYERVENWAKIPEYFILGDPADLTIDSKDRIFVGSRGNHPVLIFDSKGNFVSCWGEGYFIDPHGMYVASDDTIYIADGQHHVVERFSLGGEYLNMRLGTRDRATDIEDRAPFNKPTGVAISPKGDIYATNGYGNFLVHKFSPDGTLQKTWGDFGNDPGQFALPHKLDIDKKGIVYVCDRNNSRVERFSPEGELIDMWTDLSYPQDIYIDRKNEIVYMVEATTKPPHQSRLSIRDMKGKVLSSWEGRESEGKGVLELIHGICVDSHGDIYVGEIGKIKQRLTKYVKV